MILGRGAGAVESNMNKSNILREKSGSIKNYKMQWGTQHLQFIDFQHMIDQAVASKEWHCSWLCLSLDQSHHVTLVCTLGFSKVVGSVWNVFRFHRYWYNCSEMRRWSEKYIQKWQSVPYKKYELKHVRNFCYVMHKLHI